MFALPVFPDDLNGAIIMKKPQQHNYTKLLHLIPDITTREGAITLQSSGFMDLYLDVLYREPNRIRIALAHYYQQNGDLVPDPDMELWVYPEAQKVTAKTFQNALVY